MTNIGDDGCACVERSGGLNSSRLYLNMACPSQQPAFQGPFTSIHPVATDDGTSVDDAADEGGRRYHVNFRNSADYVLQVHRYFIGAADTC
jgi:hypothetical protein